MEFSSPNAEEKVRADMPPRRRKTVEVVEDTEETVEGPKPVRRRGRPRATTPAVKEKPVPQKAESNGLGTTWLMEYVNEELGTSLDGKAIRVILRELASEGIGERDDKSRYTFSGPKDRTVLAVLKRVRTADETPSLRTRKAPVKKAAPVRRGRPKKVQPVEDDPDLPDFDDEEIEDL